MQWFRTGMIAAVITAVPLTASAEGLLYKLPADGAKVVYDMKLTAKRGDMTMTIDGTLSLASVGKAKVDGADCRWIEVSMKMMFQGMERVTTAKLLVPEGQLGKGKDPLAHVKKAWLKQGERPAKELKEPKQREGGPLPAFFPAKLTNVKKLKPETIKTGIGELKCEGVTATTTYKQGDDRSTKVDYRIRRNDKAPFGVAACTMKVQETRNGETRDAAELEFTLKSVEKDAKSTLPDKT